MSGVIVDLHIIIWMKTKGKKPHDEAVFLRAYKYLDKPKGLTPRFQHFVYSQRAKRYITANFYTLEWDGLQNHGCAIEHKLLRASLLRIGLDTR